MIAAQEDHVFPPLKPVRQSLAALVMLLHQLSQLLRNRLQASYEGLQSLARVVAPPAYWPMDLLLDNTTVPH